MQRIWWISCNAWISLQRCVRLRSLDINTHEATLLKFKLDGTMGWAREKHELLPMLSFFHPRSNGSSRCHIAYVFIPIINNMLKNFLGQRQLNLQCESHCHLLQLMMSQCILSAKLAMSFSKTISLKQPRFFKNWMSSGERKQKAPSIWNSVLLYNGHQYSNGTPG